VTTTSTSELVDAFHNRVLPKPQWTHEAHLIVCWSALKTRTVNEATAYLRQAIRAYNDSVGTPNTDTSGYHETLTRYYVEAIAQLTGESVEQVQSSAHCQRQSPFTYWSRDLLFGTEARRDWVDPDLQQLPWREGD